MTGQDHPMLIWRTNHITEFLHELIRLDGLGEHQHGPTCSTCLKSIPIPSPSTPAGTTTGLLRCQDCHGDCVECVSCCLKRHARLPLHRTQVYFNLFFTGMQVTNIMSSAIAMDRPILAEEEPQESWARGPTRAPGDGLPCPRQTV